MARYLSLLVSFYLFGCNLNSEQLVNLEKYTFDEIKFNAVSKNLSFENSVSEIEGDLAKKEIQNWFNNKIKTDGLEGKLSIVVDPIKIKKTKYDEYYKFEINLSMKFFEINKILNSEKVYKVNSIEFGEIKGSFTIKDQDNLNINIIRKSLDNIGKKLISIN